MNVLINRVEKKKNKTILLLSSEEKIELSNELYLKYLFHEGDSLSEEEKDKFIFDIEIYKIRQSSLKYLSGRNHSKFELKVKLLKKGYDKDLIEIILEELTKNNLLNDYIFVQNYFEIKLKKSVGINKIKSELIKKGIDRSIIEEIAKDYYDSPLLIDSACKLIRKKYATLKNRNVESKKIRQKIYFSVSNKGYSKEIILDAFRKLKL